MAKSVRSLAAALLLSLWLSPAWGHAGSPPDSMRTSPAPAQEASHARAPRFAVAVEPGVNSLASIAGLAVSFYPSSRIAVDAGAGFGLLNLKYGLRVRGFFADWGSWFHPYAGASWTHAKGWGNRTQDISLEVKRNGGTTHSYDFTMGVDASDFLGGQFGVELRFGHFLLRPGLGWTWLVGGRNWHVVDGNGPEGRDRFPIDLMLGGGPTAFLGIGFGW